ncbi:MAG: MarR family winged helix-turn-helix transcriptional regulator [Clostridia bacterium]|nr:MarR family winged helix-turn-helix transcriptional regulator [Clostridia bacterium]
MASEKDIKHFANTFMDITENIQKVVPVKESELRKYRLLKGIRDYEKKYRKHITLSDIAHQSGMALPNVSRYLKPFEEAGYIERQKSGRTVFLCITAKGNSVIAGHLMDIVRHITLLLNSFPEDELPDFLEKCDKFSETIHNVAEKKNTGDKNAQDLQKSAAD